MPTPNCPPERGRFICICVTAQTVRENAGQGSRQLPPTCACPAPRSNGHWLIWSSTGICKRSHATVTMGAAHPTCIPCSKVAEKRSPPSREDCAYLLNPGEVHDGPPRRTHSIGDLIQRKNKSHFRNCSKILYNVQTIKKSIGYPKHKYNFYWIFSAYRNSLDLRWHRSKTQRPSSVGADIS